MYVELTFLSNWPNFFQNWQNYFDTLAGKQFRDMAALIMAQHFSLVEASATRGTTAKTSSPGRKTVPGLSHSGAREEEGEETSGSENETRLVAG